VRLGRTLGTPIAILVDNRDHANWRPLMSPEPPLDDARSGLEAGSAGQGIAVTIPRPGHADLAGLMKYGHDDVRDVLERASARETVGRVAAGAVCKRLLAELGVTVAGRVLSKATLRQPRRRFILPRPDCGRLGGGGDVPRGLCGCCREQGHVCRYRRGASQGRVSGWCLRDLVLGSHTRPGRLRHLRGTHRRQAAGGAGEHTGHKGRPGR
jgi:hypothetical protein